MKEQTPYERGYAAGLAGQPAPPFTTPDSSWADRLYARGWYAGCDARIHEGVKRDADKHRPAAARRP